MGTQPLRCLAPRPAECWVVAAACCLAGYTAQAAPPNVVFIFADDMGYGEIEALNPGRCKAPTPSLDALAEQGVAFTDAHTSSSVCTPSRYSLLTGRYAWRTTLQQGVVQAHASSLIAEGRTTLGDLFREQGYDTAVIGKWHLNYRYEPPKGATGFTKTQVRERKKMRLATVPVGTRIPDGPLTRGFDVFYGFHHAGSMNSVVRGDEIVEETTAECVLPNLTREVVAYIDAHSAGVAGSKPFFLYFPMSSPHTPIVPTDEWRGRTPLGPYGDFVAQTDGAVGEVMAALDRNGLSDNTILFFSADNGTSKAAGLKRLAAMGHYPSANMRGSKADLWDGGHRVPFLVRWPGQVEPGSTSSQLVCLSDLVATFAEFFSVELPEDTAEDSVSFLRALLSEPNAAPRDTVVHHSIRGHFAIRRGDWKLLLAPGSGGWTAPNGRAAIARGLPEMQLYNLREDIGEQTNLIDSEPQRVAELLAILEELVERGRSTPGASQPNDAPIDLWKMARWAGG